MIASEAFGYAERLECAMRLSTIGELFERRTFERVRPRLARSLSCLQ